jgi:hypothetical protein
MYFVSSMVIQYVEAMCKAGNASIAHFYFDFRDTNKQGPRDVLISFITQLSSPSNPHCDIVFGFYLVHDEGKKQPSETILAECLNEHGADVYELRTGSFCRVAYRL